MTATVRPGSVSPPARGTGAPHANRLLPRVAALGQSPVTASVVGRPGDALLSARAFRSLQAPRRDPLGAPSRAALEALARVHQRITA